ncbi:hypothetical protein [Variovorax paradoxus]|uniref:hypothetical protein n=1 Tax=Variovorax paradoxus TaxID=34073 RepID=UPI0006E6B284|nr:hypothetical protein APR52_20880 [Variovorax paradoxus]KPV11417.1 hypothetical protein APR49_09520 [Variovorax paradoxus]KPV23306.1 hypothetical protein APR51_08080 [Variovorax paradoxus]
MGEREMLERAAKAAGLDPTEAMWHPRSGFVWVKRVDGIRTENRWNPLTDDGDALRLAVKLHLEITHNHPLDNDAWVMAIPNGQMVGPTEEVDGEENRAAATRLAITRAAASLTPAPEGEQHG